MNDELKKRALDLHERLRGKIEIRSKIDVKTRDDLALTYTPGVGAVSRAIADDPSLVMRYTMKPNTVAVVSDGSAVLGLGNIGPEAALPVMEGKALLFKVFGGVDAFPICLATQDEQEIIKTVRAIAPVFGGINLEDIAAPKCFAIEEALQDLGIPVMHDDQHGTAIVVRAALMNAARVVQKKFTDLRVVISGAGAAGIAVTRLLQHASAPVADVIVCDSKGIVESGRTDLNPSKEALAKETNHDGRAGTLADALVGADVFIGVSVGGIVSETMVRSMAKDAIVFAMANPDPEIMPADAHRGGAAIVATGRSDFPNQVNNVLAFPGVFRGALDIGAPHITTAMKLAAAEALAACVEDPTSERILPSPLEPGIAERVADAIRNHQ